MSKSAHLRRAAVKLEEAIAKLKEAKRELLAARSEQHVPLAVQIAALEEIYEILTDPVCTPDTPEIAEVNSEKQKTDIGPKFVGGRWA